MAQSSVEAARRAAAVLALGPVRQIVLVGAEHKLAVFAVGAVVVGIIAPVTVDLGASLAQ